MELVITIGPWQSLMATAALRQAGIVSGAVCVIDICNPGEEALIEVCRCIHAEAGHHFLGALSARYIHDGSFIKKDAALFAAMQKASRIWTFAIQGRCGYLLDYLPRSPIVIYEDGLLSGSPAFVYGEEWRWIQCSFFSYLRLCAKKSLFHRRLWFHLPAYRRIESIYTFLHELHENDALPSVPKVVIRPEVLGEVLAFCGKSKTAPEESGKPRALILGSNFSKAVHMLPSLEYGIIEEAIRDLEGEYEIWWKPHPRADPLFTRYLALSFPSLKVFDPTLYCIPAECLIQPWNFSLVTSPMSSSLLYCKKLFKLDTYITPGIIELLPSFNRQSFLEVYSILERHVPLLNDRRRG